MSAVPDTRIADADAWTRLRADWSALHAASPEPTFFLSPLWMDAWLATYGASLSVRFIEFLRGGRLVGMGVLTDGRQRRGPVRLARCWLGTAGEGADSPMVEHNQLLTAVADSAPVAHALRRLLECSPWDEYLLNGVREDDWEALRPAACGQVVASWRDAPFVDLQALRSAGTPFLDSLSRNTRQQIRRSLTLYQARGDFALEHTTETTTALGWFDELVELHDAAWRARGKPGAFATERQRAFHRRLIEAGVPAGQVQLLRLTSAGQTVGVLYNFVFEGHIAYYQSGFRYETDNRIKPGLVSHTLAIERALAAGARAYDLLAVADDGARYKHSLANANRRLGWIVCTRRTPKSRIAAAWTAARRFRARA